MREPKRPKTGRGILFYLMLILGTAGVVGFLIVAIAAGHRGGG